MWVGPHRTAKATVSEPPSLSWFALCVQLYLTIIAIEIYNGQIVECSV